MSGSRIPLLDIPALEKYEEFYAVRHDHDARLIIRLIEDCKWYRAQENLRRELLWGVKP